MQGSQYVRQAQALPLLLWDLETGLETLADPVFAGERVEMAYKKE